MPDRDRYIADLRALKTDPQADVMGAMILLDIIGDPLVTDAWNEGVGNNPSGRQLREETQHG